MPYEPPPELSGLSLAEIAELAAARKLPPVAQWEPAHVDDSHMRIAADGRWFHEDGEIRRPAMVRAFAALLTRDKEGRHWLVTPSQKLSIEVEDAAFIAVDLKREGSDIAFRLNTDDLVIAGPDHPIRSHGDPDTPALYLRVRNGTEARLNRSTYAQLVEIALENEELAVTSGGASFPLVPA
ncbi:DUF1285 domain-containing protein [Novosphingobium pentaromativorans]|uniref:Proteophosphoglycan n=1 Tax=Novosphingobium pentaromativorans US6-1 TaxID=1088721 RepID=G6EID8_9SPHN|nr:DUF1285 domain-containing protein [Novosphingobium pentaromativorans]AIT78763.1 proteophosphoglycan precursor [Novosphingobium pentaromativorans US6-1]EHJ58880.1 hypothetical protein NSU_4109 [Novosphingobium pentaromativorans US6-1]